MHTADYYSSKTLFFSNFASNVGFFGLNTVVGILFVPYLIHHLGVASYGLIPLTMSIASYFNVATVILNSAAWRNMSLALQRDEGDANKIFNSSFWISVFFGLILLALGIIFSFFINHWFNVPAGSEIEAMRLVFLTMIGFSLFSVCSSFGIITYSLNRLDLQNLGNTLGLITRVSVVILLFNIYGAHLWHVGVGLLASAVVILSVDIWAWRYLLPEIKINVKEISFTALKVFSKTSFWLIIDRFGTIILVSMNLLIANKLFSPELSGRFASVMQWSIFLTNFGIVLAAIFGPSIMAYYARGDSEGLLRYSRKSIKFIGLLFGLPIGLICGFSKPLLSVWLGGNFTSLALLMIVMTFHLCANLAYLPLDTVLLAMNKVRLVSIVQILLVIINVPLAIGLARGVGLGMYGIAFAGMIVLSARNIFFNSIYTSILLKNPPFTLLRELGLLIAAPAAVSIVAYGVTRLLPIHSWLTLISGCVIVSLVYMVFVWKVLLTKDEQSLAGQFLKRS